MRFVLADALEIVGLREWRQNASDSGSTRHAGAVQPKRLVLERHNHATLNSA
jgi:hypothetical protein